MTSKSKFQVAQSLADRIARISSVALDYEPSFADLEHSFILGFRCSKQNNFIGLTTSLELQNSGLAILGLSFFKTKPAEDKLAGLVESIVEFTNSDSGTGTFKTDKDNNLFLVYYPTDDSSKNLTFKLYDSNLKQFLIEQPSIVIVDDSKIFSESIVTSLKCSLRLNICNEASELLAADQVKTRIDEVIQSFNSSPAKVQLTLQQSNFSCNFAASIASTTESLYEKLEPPADVLSMGDYLPQMSKKEKEAAVTKWKNKLKNQRAPLELVLEHQDYSIADDDSISKCCCAFYFETFIYLQANNPLTKSLRYITFQVSQTLRSLRDTLLLIGNCKLEHKALKSCTFKPTSLGHFVSTVYPIPEDSSPDFELLSNLRRSLHLAYLIPLDKPALRFSQRIKNVKLETQDELEGYLCNVHSTISANSGVKGGACSVIEGAYAYHHYMQGRISDNGWGCAYRSLQTIISWYKNQGYICSPDVHLRADNKGSKDGKSNQLRLKLHQQSRVPTHEEIQIVLVEIGDKQPSFVGSQKWIGSQEVCYVLNHLYDLDSKFISVSSGSELVYKARDLSNHFSTQSTPVMIGGGVLAHTIIGVDFHEKSGDISYLILDPHYTGSEDLSTILKKGWCGWKKNSFWDKNAFYNLCLPQRPIEF